MAKAKKTKVRPPLPTLLPGQAFLLTSDYDDFVEGGDVGPEHFEVDVGNNDTVEIRFFKIDLNELLSSVRGLPKVNWRRELNDRLLNFPYSLADSVLTNSRTSLEDACHSVRQMVFDVEAGQDVVKKGDRRVVILSTRALDQAVKPFIFEMGKRALNSGYDY